MVDDGKSLFLSPSPSSVLSSLSFSFDDAPEEEELVASWCSKYLSILCDAISAAMYAATLLGPLAYFLDSNRSIISSTRPKRCSSSINSSCFLWSANFSFASPYSFSHFDLRSRKTRTCDMNGKLRANVFV